MPTNKNNNYAEAYEAWSGSPLFDFTLSSGVTCQMKEIDMTDLMGTGIADEIDFLSSAVSEEIDKRGPKKPSDRPKRKPTKAEAAKAEKENDEAFFQELRSDPQKLGKFTGAIDLIVTMAVIQPTLLPRPDSEEDRVPGLAYIDRVSFNDKMEIFNRAMNGTTKMEPFRSGPEQNVGDVESS